jgi:hypothetical protein
MAGYQPPRDDEQSRQERPFGADQIGGFGGKNVKAFLCVAPVPHHGPPRKIERDDDKSGTRVGIHRRRTSQATLGCQMLPQDGGESGMVG